MSRGFKLRRRKSHDYLKVTDLLASSTSSSAVNTTRDLIGKYYNPIVDLFNDNSKFWPFFARNGHFESSFILIFDFRTFV